MKAVDGVDLAIRAFGKMKTEDGIRIADGLAKCGAVIYRKSQKYVPVERGYLKATGNVVTTGRGLHAVTTVNYGGLSVNGQDVHYAIYVHENLTATHAPPTCARFLVRAARETRGTCASIIKRNMLVSDIRSFAAMPGYELVI